MALIAMAVYDTEENKRAKLTYRTVECLLKTVDFNKHRLFIIDNASCEESNSYIYKLAQGNIICLMLRLPQVQKCRLIQTRLILLRASAGL